ncbi:MAG: UvrD-helicase domain-containing protein [Oribacterium sp.]|nr:UvrD-helicase domain-containing protein [Oribacterium sp.]
MHDTETKDTIFQEEQAHLTGLYQQLIDMQQSLRDELQEISRKAAEEKSQQSEDLNYNFHNDEEGQETLIEFETMSRAVAQLNIDSQSVSTRLADVQRLLPRPYFARITVQFDEDEAPEDFYIGAASCTDAQHEQLVVDWRSPIAEVYYNHENGETSYEVDGRKIPVTLKLRRQFDITRNVLHAYFDTKVALEDPLLIRSLTRKRTDKLQSITETIQEEQNKIIRYPDVPVLLVAGIAGSGKTSILLQRIAYLFYRQRKTLRPEQVALITLNPVFQQYIDHVLPEMGEANPVTMTWSDFLGSLKVDSRGEADMTEAETFRTIDAELPSLKIEDWALKNINLKKSRVLSKKQIAAVLRTHRTIPTGSRLMQTTVDELLERAKKNALKLERKQEQDFTKDADMEDPEDNPVENQMGGIVERIRSFDWLDIDAIGKRLLGKEELTPAEYIYLKLTLTGLCDRSTKYVIVDEVQDYTEAQLLVLKKYFRRAHFMFLGDEFQSIHRDTITFKRLRELFLEEQKEVVELPLLTSYRSSPEITGLFTGLLPEETRVHTSSVQRPGIEPEIKAFAEHEAYVEALREAIHAYNTEDGLTAVIVEDWTGINHMMRVLGDDMPRVIRQYEALPKSGIVLMELKLAKGLEFDTVILPDVTAEDYPDEPMFRHRLYTAISRATERIIILSDGVLSPIIRSLI